MSKFKIGDKVRVKADVEEGGIYNGILFNCYDNARLRGRELVVKSVEPTEDGLSHYCYFVGFEHDVMRYVGEDALELVEQPVSKFKVGDTVRLKKDVRAGKSYNRIYATVSDIIELKGKELVVRALGGDHNDVLLFEGYDTSHAMGQDAVELVEEPTEDPITFREGDIVLVRPDIEIGEEIGGFTFVSQMKPYRGKLMKVKDILSGYYTLEGASTGPRTWYFSQDMLIPVMVQEDVRGINATVFKVHHTGIDWLDKTIRQNIYGFLYEDLADEYNQMVDEANWRDEEKEITVKVGYRLRLKAYNEEYIVARVADGLTGLICLQNGNYWTDSVSYGLHDDIPLQELIGKNHDISKWEVLNG